MTMVAKCQGQPGSEWHVTKAASLRDAHVTTPLRTLDAHLSMHEIHSFPREADDLAQAKPGVAAQEHDDMGVRIEILGCVDQSPVLIEVRRTPLSASAW